jgi:hypothetical protein
MSFEDLADFLVATPQFQQDILKGNVTVAHQTEVLLKNFGLTPGNTDPASADAQAEKFITDSFNAGRDIGDIVIEAGLYLLGNPAPEFADTANLFKNKILVAEIYSRENADDNVPDLQFVLAGVTAAGPANEADAIAYLDGIGIGGNPGQSFTLTLNEDSGPAFVGTVGNDTFNAPIVDGSETLQSFDVLNGNGGAADTLKATVNGGATVTPSLTGIENVEVRSVFDGSGIDFSASTGVEKVTVANSTGTTVIAGAGDIGSLSVSNQSKDVKFSGSTATELTVNLTNVAANGSGTIDLDDAVATTLTLNLNGAGTALDIDKSLTISQNEATATTVTANVTGANFVIGDALDAAKTLSVAGTGSLTADGTLAALDTLNVSGGASVDLSAVDTLTALKTVAAGDTTGVISVIVDDTAVAVATGAGNDKVVYTAGIAAGATVTLGAGDDELTGIDADKTATVNAGDGTDTLTSSTAAIVALTADTDKSAVFTGFEVLKVTDVAAGTIDVSKIAGVTSFFAADGVLGGAAVTGVGADATVTLAGNLAINNGPLTVTLKDATGSSDTLNLTLNADYVENNDLFPTVVPIFETVSAAGVEVLNVTSTGTASTAFLGETGTVADGVSNSLALTDDALTTLNISGDQAFFFGSADAMTKLATINAADNTAGVTISVATAKIDGTAAAITIAGSSGDDIIVGSGNADTISGGAGNDIIIGGAKADALAGGEGNDIFTYTDIANSTLVNLDVISDFKANTFGNGTNGAANETGAAADATKWTGDVIDLSGVTGFTKIDVSVQANSSDAQTFLQNLGQNTGDTLGAALDSSTGRVFIDVDSNGTADMVIQLTGVTTIDEAAFIIDIPVV